MKKALVPMVASLAICGAATVAMIADSARAETQPRRPMMVAMLAPHALFQGVTAAPQVEGGGPPGMRRPSAAEMAAQHKQMCQDAYAHQVGELAYQEAKLGLTPAQQPLFDRWKSAKLDIAKRGEADCSTHERPARDAKTQPTPLDGMAREEDMLKRRLADLDAERPVLTALYNALSAAQKETLLHPGGMAMGGRVMERRMFARDMGPRRDRMEGPREPRNRPPGGPGAPPPPPPQQ